MNMSLCKAWLRVTTTESVFNAELLSSRLHEGTLSEELYFRTGDEIYQH
jgi:hypothetical protein